MRTCSRRRLLAGIATGGVAWGLAGGASGGSEGDEEAAPAGPSATGRGGTGDVGRVMGVRPFDAWGGSVGAPGVDVHFDLLSDGAAGVGIPEAPFVDVPFGSTPGFAFGERGRYEVTVTRAGDGGGAGASDDVDPADVVVRAEVDLREWAGHDLFVLGPPDAPGLRAVGSALGALGGDEWSLALHNATNANAAYAVRSFDGRALAEGVLGPFEVGAANPRVGDFGADFGTVDAYAPVVVDAVLSDGTSVRTSEWVFRGESHSLVVVGGPGVETPSRDARQPPLAAPLLWDSLELPTVQLANATGVDLSFLWNDRHAATLAPGETGEFTRTLPHLPNSVEVVSPGAGRGAPGAGRGAPGAGRGAPGAGRGVPGAGRGVPGAGRGVPGAGRGAPGAGHGVPGAGRGVPDAGHGVPSAGRGVPVAGGTVALGEGTTNRVAAGETPDGAVAIREDRLRRPVADQPLVQLRAGPVAGRSTVTVDGRTVTCDYSPFAPGEHVVDAVVLLDEETAGIPSEQRAGDGALFRGATTVDLAPGSYTVVAGFAGGGALDVRVVADGTARPSDPLTGGPPAFANLLNPTGVPVDVDARRRRGLPPGGGPPPERLWSAGCADVETTAGVDVRVVPTTAVEAGDHEFVISVPDGGGAGAPGERRAEVAVRSGDGEPVLTTVVLAPSPGGSDRRTDAAAVADADAVAEADVFQLVYGVPDVPEGAVLFDLANLTGGAVDVVAESTGGQPERVVAPPLSPGTPEPRFTARIGIGTTVTVVDPASGEPVATVPEERLDAGAVNAFVFSGLGSDPAVDRGVVRNPGPAELGRALPSVE